LGKKARTAFSIRRARRNFFRLVHHNNLLASTVTFITLTYAFEPTYKEATRHLAWFVERLKKGVGNQISWIAVPELTKKGRFHFHMLLYDLPAEIAESEPSTDLRQGIFESREGQVSVADRRARATRNLQRCFRAGYVDIGLATYRTGGLAGYMGKYMAKALRNGKLEARRGYNCSRNIQRPAIYSANDLAGSLDMIWDLNTSPEFSTEYEVRFVGQCKKNVYTGIVIRARNKNANT